MIQIRKFRDSAITSVKVDGVELSDYASEFSVTQKAGEVAEITLKIPVIDGLEIELPDGVTVIERNTNAEE